MNTTSKTPTSGTAPAAPPSPLFPSASGSTAAPQDKNPLQTESCTAAPQSIQDQIHQPNSPIRHHAPIIHPAHGTPQDIGDIIARKLSALTLLLTAGALALDGAHAADYVGSGDASIDSGSWGSVYGLKGQPRTGNAQAEQARVSISGGTVSRSVYGGYARSDNGAALAGSNTVTISGMSGSAYSLYGGYARSEGGDASASSNSLSISGSPTLGEYPQAVGGYAYSSNTIGGRVLSTNNRVNLNLDTEVPLDLIVGGRSMASTSPGTATGTYGNSITLTKGNVTTLYGGWSSGADTADASGNTILISGGQVTYVVGGEAHSSTQEAIADGNTISITGGNHAHIIAGSVQSDQATASASDNAVYLRDTTVDSITGGYSTNAETAASLDGNSIVVDTGAVVLSDIHGGDSISTSSDNSASYNTIAVIGGGQVQGEIIGGYLESGSGSASQNTITISNSTVGGNISGGRSAQGGDVSSNSITIEQNAQVQGDIVGGEVQSGSGSASQNTLLVSNSTVEGNVYGGRSAQGGDVGSNSITIEQNAQVRGDIVGGEVQSGSGSASQNVVIVSNSKVEGSVCGGRAAGGGDASNNTIAIVGGSQVQGSLTGGEIGSGEASHNTIVVNNGSVHGDICGGRAAAGGSATGNSIILGQQARLSPTISLFGGVVGSEAVTPSGSGNTLFVDDWQGTVERAAGFANLHFVLPAPGTVEADIPMLTVSAAQTNDFNGTTVTAQLPEIITGGRAYLGATFELVHDNSGAIAKANAGSLVSLQQGYTTLYDGVILQDDTSVYIRIDDSRPNPNAGALTEARIGTAALLNQGGDLLAGTVLFTADTAARETRGWAVFATMYGGATDLTTESDITTRGMSLVTGLAHRRESTRTNVLVGAFFEMGFANLSTDRAIENTTISGSGDADYSGGGLFARVGITHGLMRGLYVEASGRVGEASTSWHSANLLDNLDRPAAYDLAMPYCGGHVGLGYALPINEKWAADFFSKYLFLYQDGCDTTINGEKFRFDSVNSARLRCGARVTGRVLPTASVYLGAAWEHEFRGKADATSLSSSIAIPSTSMQGDSAVFELGMRVQPKSVPVQFDCAIEGAAGTRESIGGRVQVMVEF